MNSVKNKIKKSVRFIYQFLRKIIFFNLYILFFILNFFVKIKVVYFRTDRIGHLSLNTEVFLRNLQYKESDNTLYIIFPDSFKANKTLYKMYKEYFQSKDQFLFFENRFIRFCLFTMISYKNKFAFVMPMNSNELELFSNTSSTLNFSKEQEQEAKKTMEKLGINTWYVCIFARDNAYLKTINENTDFSYHDYRNADIDSFQLATKYIIDNGGSVVRIGSMVEKRMDFQHERFVDYSYSEYKSELMDLYLVANSRFVLASTSGGTDICSVFGIPRVGVNFIPIDHFPFTSSQDIGIPKKLKKDGKYISLKEYNFISSNLANGSFWQANSYKEQGIEIEDNTKEEILDITKEMIDILENKILISKSDEINQELYQKEHLKSFQFSEVKTLISWSFLRKNPWFIKEIRKDLIFLDFDGVLFDTLREAYAVATISQNIYKSIEDVDFESSHFKFFRKIRYLISPAWNYKYLLKSIEEVNDLEKIKENYLRYIQNANKDDYTKFEEKFFSTRQRLKAEDYDKWFRLNTPFPFLSKVKYLFENYEDKLMIVTTKDKSTVLKLLNLEDISINPAKIYDKHDYEVYGNKKNIIEALLGDNKGIFLDDSQKHIDDCSKLENLECYQPEWGYVDSDSKTSNQKDILTKIYATFKKDK